MTYKIFNILSFFQNDLTGTLSKLIFKDNKNYNEDCFSKAQELIQNNPNATFNFYQKYKYRGLDFSLIRIAFINDENLFLTMLRHPSMQNKLIHDKDFLFEKLQQSQELRVFYKQYLLSTPEPKPLSFLSSLQGKSNFLEEFKDYPSEEKWRLFIDSEKQIAENGWLDFELREPGYLAGMYEAWEYLGSSIEEEVSIKLIKALHIKCSEAVKGMNKAVKPGCFREDKLWNGLIENKNATSSGLIELIESVNYGQHYYIEPDYIIFPILPLETLDHYALELISAYNHEIVYLKQPEDKLSRIIGLISSLERLHPFGDGNTRVFSMLLLNRELIKHGFSPTIMKNPNRSVGFSQGELYNEVIEGMQIFQEIKQGKFLGKSSQQIQELLASDPNYYGCKDSPENGMLFKALTF